MCRLFCSWLWLLIEVATTVAIMIVACGRTSGGEARVKL